MRFEIKDDFYLEGKPFKILSWCHSLFLEFLWKIKYSLYKLKALGLIQLRVVCSLEHETWTEGEFLTLKEILLREISSQTAQDLGLHAPVRPFLHLSVQSGNSVVYLHGWMAHENEPRLAAA